MEKIVLFIMNTPQRGFVLRWVFKPFFCAFSLGARGNPSLDALASKAIKWSFGIAAVAVFILTLPLWVELPASEYAVENVETVEADIDTGYYLPILLSSWYIFAFSLIWLRIGYKYRDCVFDVLGPPVLKPLHPAAISILNLRDKNKLAQIFFKPFYNALKKGASMCEEDAARMSGLMVVGFIMIYVFSHMAFGEADLFSLILVIFFSIGIFIFIAVQYGYIHRSQIELTSDVAAFDYGVVAAGGAWSVAGMGLVSLYKLYFGG